MQKKTLFIQGFYFLTFLFIASWWLGICRTNFSWGDLESFRGLLMLYAVIGGIYHLPTKIAKFSLFVLMFLVSVFFVIDVFCVMTFELPFNSLMFSSILQTNAAEMSEFISTYLHFSFIVSVIGFVFFSLIFFKFFHPNDLDPKLIYGTIVLGVCIWTYEGYKFVKNDYSCNNRKNLYSLSLLRYGCEIAIAHKSLKGVLYQFDKYAQIMTRVDSTPPPPHY